MRLRAYLDIEGVTVETTAMHLVIGISGVAVVFKFNKRIAEHNASTSDPEMIALRRVDGSQCMRYKTKVQRRGKETSS